MTDKPTYKQDPWPRATRPPKRRRRARRPIFSPEDLTDLSPEERRWLAPYLGLVQNGNLTADPAVDSPDRQLCHLAARIHRHLTDLSLEERLWLASYLLANILKQRAATPRRFSASAPAASDGSSWSLQSNRARRARRGNRKTRRR